MHQIFPEVARAPRHYFGLGDKRAEFQAKSAPALTRLEKMATLPLSSHQYSSTLEGGEAIARPPVESPEGMNQAISLAIFLAFGYISTIWVQL